VTRNPAADEILLPMKRFFFTSHFGCILALIA